MKRISALALVALAACADRDAADEAAANETVAPARGMAAETDPVAPAPLPAAASASQFTSTKEGDCRLLEHTTEEAGFWRRACPGAGGFKVETTEGDLRQNMVVIAPDGARTSLALPGRLGAGFSEIGETVEWRGPTRQPFSPRTLTLRYDVVEQPDRPNAETSYLAVARLADKPCVIAKVPPGTNQSAEARRIADAEALPGCLPDP